MTPSLSSTRLILTPYTPKVVTDEHVRWLLDAELMQYSEQRYVKHDLTSQIAYVGHHFPNRHLWLIRCACRDIGTVSAYIDTTNNRANLGILIGSREHQGQGFAAEAWCAVIDWLFSIDIHKVECGCRSDNHRMRRLATTTGFTLEGEVPGHFKVGDEYRGLILYGRFKSDTYHSEWDEMFLKPGTA